MADTTRNPLTEIASKIGTGWSALSGVIGALVSYGVLSGAQGEALTAAGAQAQDTVTAFGTVLGGVLPLIAGVVSAFSTAKVGEGKVTPVADPRANDGTPLVPAPAPVVKPAAAEKRVADPGTVGDTWTS